MSDSRCSRWFLLVVFVLFAGAFATGCQCTGTLKTSGFHGQMEVEPNQVMADGVATARVTVRVFSIRDDSPVEGAQVLVLSGRNQDGSQVDDIVGSGELTDENGEVVVFISSATEGEAALTATVSGVDLCELQADGSCTPIVRIVSFVTECGEGLQMCGGQCVDTSSDPENCGECDVVCSYDHAAASCVEGSCEMGACDQDWGDCNNDDSDGCETDLLTDVNNCGTCGNVCDSGTCDGGSCVECTDEVCDGVDNDCDGLTDEDPEASADCDDGLYCTGDAEYCQDGTCHAGDPVDCDDGVDCTIDNCVEATQSCEHIPDHSRCTGEELCDPILDCVGGECTADQHCDDGSYCSGVETCVDGFCQRGTVVDCDDGIDCTDDSCNEVTRSCWHDPDPTSCDDSNVCTDDVCDLALGCVNTPNTGPCNDGLYCNGADTCDGAGNCTVHAGDPCAASGLSCDETLDTCADCIQDSQCDDSNPCTDDACVATVCENTPNTDACNDGLVCTTGDVCSGGVCQGTADHTACNDGVACTVDRCTPGDPGADADGCVFTPDETLCNDSNMCTVDACDPASGCTHDSAAMEGLGCTDGANCTTGDTCTGGVCVATPDDALCDDGVDCTIDVCDPTDPGATGDGCVISPDDSACDDGNQCTDDSCDLFLGDCLNENHSRACDDGLFCNGADTCDGAGACAVHAGDPCAAMSLNCDEDNDVCYGCTDNSECADGDVCTDDICNAGTCENPFNTASCDDSIACTTGDVCAGGVCAGTPTDAQCDDSVACTVDTCVPADPGADANGCLYTPDDTACDDGDQCTADSCNATTGCVFDAAAMNGQSCDDSVACTTGDVCAGGLCAGTPDDSQCGDGVGCTTDACLPGDPGADADGCLFTPDDTACDDSNVCTQDSCNAASGCINDGTPLDGSACDDGHNCTDPDTCASGACVGTPQNSLCGDGVDCTVDTCDPSDTLADADGCLHTPDDASCSDGDQCTADSCNASSGCVNDSAAMEGLSCDDSVNCTTGDVCTSGNCAGTLDHSACDDSVDCSVDVCDPTDPGADADGCVNTEDDAQCDDTNECTDDTCEIASGGCVFTPHSRACDDLLYCNGADTCDGAGGCTVHTGDPCVSPLVCDEDADACVGCVDNTDCDDGNVCTDDVCNASQNCENNPNTESCDDGFACTTGDACSGGSCQGTPDDSACDDSVACTVDTCDPADQDADAAGCVFTPDDAACDDGDQCTLDTCDPSTGCDNDSSAMEGLGCNDTYDCTTGDVCTGGVCGGTTDDSRCGDGIACTTDACDPADTGADENGCVFTPDDAVCDDGNECTANTCNTSTGCETTDQPSGTQCGDQTDTDCDNPNSCDGSGTCLENYEPIDTGCGSPDDTDCDNPDTCDGAGNCLVNHEPAGTACDDSDPCTNDECDGNGVCIHPPDSVQVIPYSTGPGLRRISGNAQFGPADATLPYNLVVQLNENCTTPPCAPRPGVQVAFAIEPADTVCYGAGGTFTPPNGLDDLNIRLVCNTVDTSTLVGSATVDTDANGQASVGLHLADALGVTVVSATADGESVNFFAGSTVELSDTLTLPTPTTTPTVNPAVGPLITTQRTGSSQAYLGDIANYTLAITGLDTGSTTNGVPSAPLAAGETLRIEGLDFEGTGTTVWVGGVQANITDEDTDFIEVDIPEGIPGAAAVVVDDGSTTAFAGGSGDVPSVAGAVANLWRIGDPPIFIYADTGSLSGSFASVKLLAEDVCGASIPLTGHALDFWVENPGLGTISTAVRITTWDNDTGVARVTRVANGDIRSGVVVGSVDGITSDDPTYGAGGVTVTAVPRWRAPQNFTDGGVGNTDGINSLIFRGGTGGSGETSTENMNPAVRLTAVDYEPYRVPDGTGPDFETEAHVNAATLT